MLLRTISKHPALNGFFVLALLLTTVLSACSDGSRTKAEDGGTPPIISIMAPLHFPHPPKQELVRESNV